MKFGTRLRKLREEREMGLREFARSAGLSPTYVSRVENGKENAPKKAETIVKWAEALEVDPDYLLACAGVISPEVRDRMQRSPRLFAKLVKLLRLASDEALEKTVRDGKW
jgi:transcriptional regulator with XRE-family HTH domain